jgi:hypothetical protein
MEKINDLYKIINDKYKFDDIDIYNEIMKREKDVRTVLERVQSIKDEELKKSRRFLETPAGKLVTNTFNSVYDTYNELSQSGKYADILAIINKNDRIIFLGLFFMGLAAVIALIHVADYSDAVKSG